MTKKTKDPIHKLLCGLPQAMFLGNPPGTIAIWAHKVEEAGGNLEEVHAWVKAHDGSRDKSYSVTTRSGFSVREQPGNKHFFVLPDTVVKKK